MDTNMKVRIMRDCLTAARESLPSCSPELWVREMPMLEFHGTMAAESMARPRPRLNQYIQNFTRMAAARMTRATGEN